jgi:hypothetical protein
MNGASNVTWLETSPAIPELVGQGDDGLRSLKTSLQQGLNDEHLWPDGGGFVGAHRLGTARAYVGTQSRVSTDGSDGRLMVTSDTSRLFGLTSAGTVLLGDATALSHGTQPWSQPQRASWAVELGQVVLDNITAETQITIPNSGYSGIPMVQAEIHAMVTAATALAFLSYNSITTTSFYIRMRDPLGTVAAGWPSRTSVDWMSIGTRAT